MLPTFENGLVPLSLVNGPAARISVRALCAEVRAWANRTSSPGAQMPLLGPPQCTWEVGVSCSWGVGPGVSLSFLPKFE